MKRVSRVRDWEVVEEEGGMAVLLSPDGDTFYAGDVDEALVIMESKKRRLA